MQEDAAEDAGVVLWGEELGWVKRRRGGGFSRGERRTPYIMKEVPQIIFMRR